MNDVLKAQQLLADDFEIQSEVWAATSYQQLHRDALETERWNRLRPGQRPRTAWVRRCLGEDPARVTVAVSDFVKALPSSIGPWVAGAFVPLGTDGFGRSDGREALRRWFEVDAHHIAWATLEVLAREGKFPKKRLTGARAALGIDPEKADPAQP